MVANPSIEVFSVPTSKYINHELTVWLPYFIKRHILRQKIERPTPIIQETPTLPSGISYAIRRYIFRQKIAPPVREVHAAEKVDNVLI